MDKPEGIALTEEQVAGLVWEPIEETVDYVVSRAVYGQGPTGPVYAYRKQIKMADAFLDGLKAERNANEGRRWSEGMGSDKNGNMPLVKLGSLPLNKWFQVFGNGRHLDKDYRKWWWQRDEAEPFKARKGNW